MTTISTTIKRGHGPRGLLRTAPVAAALMLLLAGCALKQPTAETDEGVAYAVREEAPLAPELQREFERALRELQAGEYAAGAARLTALTRNPQAQASTAPYINLGIAYRKLGQLERAEESLNKARALNPEHPVANNEYGMLLRRLGRFQEARSAYEGVLAAYPEFLPARKNLGILCDLYLGDLACALEHYRIYHAALPGDEGVALWIADLQARVGR